MRFPLLLPSGAALKITQASSGGILGGTIWPAADTLCRYLVHLQKEREKQQQQQQLHYQSHHGDKPMRVIELGSGTGVVGLYAAGLGMQVTLTEHRPPFAAAMTSVPYSVDGSLEDVVTMGEDPRSDVLLNLLQTNVRENRHLFSPEHLPIVQELDWTIPNHTDRLVLEQQEQQAKDGEGGFDLIIASDVTYVSKLHNDLAMVIRKILQMQTKLSSPSCLIAHQQRVLNLRGVDHQLESFMKSLDKVGLELRDIDFVDEDNDNDKQYPFAGDKEVEHSVKLFEICVNAQ